MPTKARKSYVVRRKARAKGGALKLAGGALRVAGGSRAYRGGKLDGSRLRRFGSRVNKFLKRTKIGSRLGKWYSTTGLPYSSQVGTLAQIADNLGYGRKKSLRLKM